ncbi:MAG: hypothetical protein P9L97_05650 [Candidatus Tenebribacter davisii]|nr:hypothetical protein [Candidatus Tenebribacter davisii]
MAKVIPGKEFKEAIKALNEVLKVAEEDSIKIVGIKKEVVVTEFTNKVLDFIENDKAQDLPDAVIDFYNNYIVEGEDEGGEAEKKPVADKAADKSKKKADKDAKTAADKATKDAAKVKKKAESDATKAKKKAESDATKAKKKADSGPSIVNLGVKAWIKGLKTGKEIEAEIQSSFPGRNIKSTISTVVCVMSQYDKEVEA